LFTVILASYRVGTDIGVLSVKSRLIISRFFRIYSMWTSSCFSLGALLRFRFI